MSCVAVLCRNEDLSRYVSEQTSWISDKVSIYIQLMLLELADYVDHQSWYVSEGCESVR